MYAYLKGELEGISEEGAIIEVNGIGYNVKLSKEVISILIWEEILGIKDWNIFIKHFLNLTQ